MEEGENEASRRSRDETSGGGWLRKGAVAGRDVAECGQVYWVTGSMRKPRKSDVVVARAQARSRVPSRPHSPTLPSSLRSPSFPKVLPGRYPSRCSGTIQILVFLRHAESFISSPSATCGRIRWRYQDITPLFIGKIYQGQSLR